MKRFIAVINWEDPTNYDTWTSAKKSRLKKPTVVVSVGVLINEDADYVRIAMDTSGDKTHCGIGVIPRRCITKIRKIPLPPSSDVK